MDKIKYSLFDLFAYLTPGFVLLNTFFYVSAGQGNFTLQGVLAYASRLNTYSFVFLILLSYCVGFLLEPCGEVGLKALQQIKPFASPRPLHHSEGHSVKHTVTREKSPENFKYVELWYGLRGFSASMGLVAAFLTVYLLFSPVAFSWKYAAVGLVSAAVFFSQAIKFNTWAVIDLDNAYNAVVSCPDTPVSSVHHRRAADQTVTT